ncbi:protein of unknown function DUF58 [Gemmatirosa kalamazoonensis]|uniref:DUF58 domain-containing protein n=1 Tax=Gemmatirosa kalamazoonensis TaxID=861299 RepID=W0RAB7_9BACT|nr:DUF58 domain-containing protein [Gemmatirosa kalamazoonensis]AHG88059.1 protein of unknown function DUF58 [Gemmatirosa kalamazoonensis]
MHDSDTRLLDELRGVRWAARKLAAATLPGAHRARLRSPGGELSEYRAYRQGDDPRRLDWRLLARSDRAFIRLADDHALLPTVLVVDASASMAFRAKWRAARALSLGLAAVAHAAGDPVGLAVAAPDARDRWLPARARRGVVHEVARALDAVTPDGDAPLAPLVTHAAAVRGTRLVLVSDFLGDEAATLRAATTHRAQGGEVYALHVLDAQELDPPRGAVLAVDPERPDVRRPLDAVSRAAYLAAFAKWRAETARAWRDAGATYVAVTTDEPPARAVRRVVRGAVESHAEARA